jgi:hypothetical protein
VKFPAWLSSSHPIVQRELSQWRKQTRALWLTFLLAPVAITGCLWLPYVWVPASASGASIVAGLFLTAWLWEIVLSLWLGFVATTRAITLVSYERETRNWPLLRLTLFDVPDILRAKIGAVFYGLRWPIVLVIGLRITALAATVLTQPDLGSPGALLVAGLFTLLFCAELVISVAYNCAVGLLASAITRSTAAANALVYLIHTLLFVLLYGPLWYWAAAPLSEMVFLPARYRLDPGHAIAAGMTFFAVMMLSQVILARLMSLFAEARVERITD